MQRHFYATSEDLLQVFDRFESTHRVVYTQMGLNLPGAPHCNSGKSISTLSSPALHPNAIAGYTYLVTPEGAQVDIREIKLRAGGVNYAIDQLANPASFTFSHGGFYATDVLLHGRIGTSSEHPDSVRLYRAFASCIAKAFSRVRAFYVGPQALSELKRGCRLTIGADSPRDYDLALVLPSGAS